MSLALQGLPLLGFQYPLNLEGLPTTDLVSGHGTFVGGVIGGSGAASGGKYKGVAPTFVNSVCFPLPTAAGVTVNRP